MIGTTRLRCEALRPFGCGAARWGVPLRILVFATLRIHDGTPSTAAPQYGALPCCTRPLPLRS